jgi:hypothetical protein
LKSVTLHFIESNRLYDHRRRRRKEGNRREERKGRKGQKGRKTGEEAQGVEENSYTNI